MIFSVKLEKKNSPKVHIEPQKTGNSQRNLCKKNKFTFILPHFESTVLALKTKKTHKLEKQDRQLRNKYASKTS